MVRLDFKPAESVFVIFRQATDHTDHVVAANASMVAPAPAPPVPKLEIQHAVYTATDGAGELDVTTKLSELAGEGPLIVAASNDALGRDPSYNHAKELRVDYTLDGKPGHATVPENETLTLPAITTIGQQPQWEIGIAKGQPVVTAWSNGQIELHTASGKVLHANASDLPAPQEMAGVWNLKFPPDWGAPPAVALDKLISWTDHTNDGVRYFSGTATYEREIEIAAERLSAGRELWLDLGTVKNFAEISLNGRDFGVLWKSPVPGEHHRRRETRYEPTDRQSHEPLAQPVDRRRASATRLRVGRQAAQGLAAMAA